MPKVPNHLHKYKKMDIGSDGNKYIVYRCMKPTCNHYIPVTLSEGKLCECNRCENPMVISKATLVHSAGKPMTRPHCNDCIKRKTSKEADISKIQEFLAGTKA
jgi:hypothetical protein